MGYYSNVENGTIHYDAIDDEVFDQVNEFVKNGGVIEAKNARYAKEFEEQREKAAKESREYRRTKPRTTTYSIYEEYATVYHDEIDINFSGIKAYEFEEEIEIIADFIQSIGIGNIDIDITIEGEDRDDIRHFKFENGKVVSAKADITITFDNYS